MTAGIFVAGAALISGLVAPFTEVPMNTPRPLLCHSADVPDVFLRTLIADCSPAGLACKPLDLVACWLHESGLAPRAQNEAGFASGFFQAMPATLRGLGFRGDERYREALGAHDEALAAVSRAKASEPAGGSELVTAKAAVRALDKALSDAFCRLTLEEQLVWAYRYYRPHAGKLANAGACYAANFVPGLLEHAGDTAFVICAADGRASWKISAAQSAEWFRVNSSLDADNDKAVTMGDLVAVAAGELAKARGTELAARLEALAAETIPAPDETISAVDETISAVDETISAVDVTDGGADEPVFATPDSSRG